jgi:hypothetical protein
MKLKDTAELATSILKEEEETEAKTEAKTSGVNGMGIDYTSLAQ